MGPTATPPTIVTNSRTSPRAIASCWFARRERLATLFEQYQRLGCKAALEIIADCGHDWQPLREATIRFFEVSCILAADN